MQKLLLLAILSFALLSFTDKDNIQLRRRNFNIHKGIALDQYDPVAYFTQARPVKGTVQFTTSYQGITYYFSSADNKATFLQNPERYEPAYGGWCAYTMGHQASKEDGDPRTFKIVNGRLLLFYNKWNLNLKPKWDADEANLLKEADVNWTNLYK